MKISLPLKLLANYYQIHKSLQAKEMLKEKAIPLQEKPNPTKEEELMALKNRLAKEEIL